MRIISVNLNGKSQCTHLGTGTTNRMIYFFLVGHLKMVSLIGDQRRLEKDILLPYHNYNHYRYYKYSRSSELIALKSFSNN